MDTKPLAPDEIRFAFTLRDRYLKAQAQLEAAIETENDYFEQLRAKYGLDESWQCKDLLIGFECEPKVTENDQND